MYTFELNRNEEPDVDQESRESKAMAAAGLTAVVGIICAPFLVWVAWNVTMPALFGLPAIGYIKSVGLYILSRVLFK
jgi:hypothetical protein